MSLNTEQGMDEAQQRKQALNVHRMKNPSDSLSEKIQPHLNHKQKVKSPSKLLTKKI